LIGFAIKFSASSCKNLDLSKKGTMAFGVGSEVLGAIGFKLVNSKN
jgi:hypothetical protein